MLLKSSMFGGTNDAVAMVQPEGQSSFVRSAVRLDSSPFRALRPAGPHELVQSRAQGHLFEQFYAAVDSTDVIYDTVCDIFMMELCLRWTK